MSDLGPDPVPPPVPPVPPVDPVPPPVDGVPTQEQRQWGLFTHLSALVGLIIPFGNILGPLVFWQIKKNEWAFADDQGKEAVNFNITVAIAGIVCFLLTFVLIGLLLLPILGIAWIVFTIIAAIKANEGVYYRYPWILRLVK
ncbi:DUF4870 domain-containing protein [Chiayiivirga flava]|uniref:DUF4870 domain-containing protein n=1 Tax=Chiayiivirga flava TaxID=659595 RepID=A0A7W8FY21_9GAMM|nr:hypothetical protein [Chiayiivirga flava]